MGEKSVYKKTSLRNSGMGLLITAMAVLFISLLIASSTNALSNYGFINGTVMDSLNKTGIAGVTVSANTTLSTTTNATGFYSFAVTAGTYNLTAKFEPMYYVNNTITISMIGSVLQDIDLLKKPVGTITGKVTTATTPGTPALPPDPSTVAPPVDATVATNIANATEFLYTGIDPIQTGVAPGTIEQRRVAVLRGRVLTREGTNLSGVNISILSHPEFGSTLSRADGMFDMAVNGGEILTVNYDKVGYLSAQRQVDVPWQDYTWLLDVVLIQADANVTAINLSSSTPIQVARGGVVNDSDGIRQETLLFPQGIQANIILPDGTTQSLTSMHVRATEYTVGASGPRAMPAQLPPTSGYTYAVELSLDEAAGAKDVRFDRPVYTYVENFLNFSVGSIVPAGYYNRSLGEWIASNNGLVIKILSITNGMADLDVNGSSLPANASQLAALNITDAERQQLASVYRQGQSLWRVPVTHFSPWDYNWPYGPPNDSVAPGQPSPQQNQSSDDPCKKRGSIIGCQNQELGEAVNIAGTPFSLYYQSGRVPGHKADNILQIPLSNASIPASLKRIDLEILVAGRDFKQSFPAAPNQSYTFIWDGKDAYGRTLQGDQPITVNIGYVYNAVYQTPAQFGQAFAQFGPWLTGNGARQEITIWQKWQGYIGPWDERGQGLGGWSLSVHHAYDTYGRVLYLGDGGRRSESAKGMIITTVAGNGIYGYSGDGGPATQASLKYTKGVAVGQDGSIYIADAYNNRIRKVGPDGIITTVAGNGIGGYSGDGGPATQAKINSPVGVAIGQDGSIYIADYGNHVRKVGTDGNITTIAGNGIIGYSGDGGPATQASLYWPQSVAVGQDGSIYIADNFNHRIRKVGTDGNITTVAGNGICCYSGDGGPATQAKINDGDGVAVGGEGSIYIADGSRIRRVGPDGIITTAAGTGYPVYGGDGGPATQAGISGPVSVSVGQDGSIYIADLYNDRIRKVGTDGIITTLAGNGILGYSGDGGPATQASLDEPYGVAVGGDGSIYIADTHYSRIRRVGSALPGFSPTDLMISSEDGSELYIFNSNGRHLRTLDALTGAMHYNFTYDTAGRLINVIDGDGNTLTIERDATGNATAIISPYGQRTNLTMDANGYIASITDPAGEANQLNYTSDGLLTNMIDPRGSTYNFSYDSLGRLIKDADPAGGIQTLERTDIADGYSVKLATRMNRNTTYQVEQLSTGDQRRVNTFPDGLKTQTIIGTNGSIIINDTDGTLNILMQGPDPRFGMQAPVDQSLSITTPGRLSQTITSQHTATLANPNNPLSLQTLNDSVNINGRTFISTFNATWRNITSLTPLGRTSIINIDNQSRVVESQIPGIVPINFTYDTRGRPNTITQGTRTYIFSYDAQGNLANITDPLSRSMSFGYDSAGRVTRQTLEDGRQIQNAYDAGGNVISITPPGRPTHSFSYTPVDLIENYTPPDIGAGPTSTRYTYDPDRQLTNITRPDGTAINIGYDSAGRPSTITYLQGTTNLAYNPVTGNLKNITAPDGGKITYAYDGSLLTDTNWSGAILGNVHDTYDNNFSIISESINGGNTVNFQYDLDGLLTRAGSLNLSRNPQNGLLTGSALSNITDTIGYSNFGEVAAYQAASSGTRIFAVNYTRDDLGRIVQKNETIDGEIHTYAYKYDPAGRLTNVSKDGFVVSQYVYDSNGNRLSYTNQSGTISGTYDNQDRLMKYGATTYNYTANGELLNKTTGSQTTTYQYDALGNLRNVTLSDGTSIEYVIDGINRRIGKKVNGVMVQGFLYRDGLRPIAELDGAGNIINRFIYASKSNMPDYMVKGGNTYRIITDHLGSPRLIVDVATGTIAQRMDYDEFGNVITDTNPGFQPFGFAGGLYDRDVRFIHFGVRDYDPEIGRWTAKDPILFAGGNMNLYGYVLNDPINRKDPIGLWEIAFSIGPIGIAFGQNQNTGEWSIQLGFGLGLGFSINPTSQPTSGGSLSGFIGVGRTIWMSTATDPNQGLQGQGYGMDGYGFGASFGWGYTWMLGGKHIPSKPDCPPQKVPYQVLGSGGGMGMGVSPLAFGGGGTGVGVLAFGGSGTGVGVLAFGGGGGNVGV